VTRIAYVDGGFLAHAGACVHIEDRGFQFGDAIYEVWSVRDGKLLDEEGHFTRLDRSLAELQISNPKSQAAYRLIIRELMRRNRITDGLVYLQISRGVAPRDHPFPKGFVRPTIVMTAKSINAEKTQNKAVVGVSVITVPDQRWGRCDIKTVNLLPNVLAKQAATEAGAYEAWQIDQEGNVTEGSSSNAWIITAEGVLVTRQADQAILRGITRGKIMECAQTLNYSFEERPFSLEEAKNAREAFMTSASSFATPIVKIDDHIVANGAPGSMALALREAYLAQ